MARKTTLKKARKRLEAALLKSKGVEDPITQAVIVDILESLLSLLEA